MAKPTESAARLEKNQLSGFLLKHKSRKKTKNVTAHNNDFKLAFETNSSRFTSSKSTWLILLETSGCNVALNSFSRLLCNNDIDSMIIITVGGGI